jgi:hypothetical protein
VRASVVQKLSAAWVTQVPPRSFDSAPSMAVWCDKSVRRSAQDDGFAGGFEKHPGKLEPGAIRQSEDVQRTAKVPSAPLRMTVLWEVLKNIPAS